LKLDVQGIEEIEITDPSGLCNPPVPQLPPGPMPGVPSPFQPAPQPRNPHDPFNPFEPTPLQPYYGDPMMPSAPWIRPIGTGDRAGDIVPPTRIPHYTHIHDPDYRTKWGLGTKAIQSAGRDIGKFQENLQAKMTGEEGQEDGNQYTS